MPFDALTPVRMRLLLLLPLLLAPALAQAQRPVPPAFGERVGDTLDATERAYFGLFPDVDGFVSATGSMGRGDTLRIAFETAPGAPPAAPRLLLPEQGHALRQYLATFEQYPTAYLNPRFQIVRPFAAPEVPVPYVNVERATVEVDAGGRRFPGVVLLASDSLLVLQPQAVAYRWTADDALALPTDSIDFIRPGPTGLARHPRLGLAGTLLAGYAVMGATSASLTFDSLKDPALVRTVSLWTMVLYAAYRTFWPRPPMGGTHAEHAGFLEAQARFGDARPYDLPPPATLQNPAFPSEPVRARRRPPLWQRWYRTYGWFSLGLMAPAEVTDRGEPIAFDEYFRNRVPDPVQPREGLRNGFEIGEALDVSVRPIPWLRFGLSKQAYAYPDLVDVHGRESAFLQPSGLRRYAEVILPSPRVHGFGVDLAVGIGTESHYRTVGRETSGTGRPLPVRGEEEDRNRYWQATADFFIRPRASVFVRYTTRDLPPLAVPRIEEYLDIVGSPNTLVYSAEAHEVTFGYSEWTWGTRFHF